LDDDFEAMWAGDFFVTDLLANCEIPQSEELNVGIIGVIALHVSWSATQSFGMCKKGQGAAGAVIHGVSSPLAPSSSLQQMGGLCCDRRQHLVPAALFPRLSSQPVMKTIAMLLKSHLRPAPHRRLQLSRLRDVASLSASDAE
jgi:hypothetical protein